MPDMGHVGEQLAAIVKSSLAAELAPILSRLAVLEDRSPFADESLRSTIGNLTERAVRLEERKPEKGEPGINGLGFDDLDVCVLDDDRTIELSFRRGEEEKVFTLKWPTVIDRGVYKAGQEYDHGDGVSFGGSFWIAQRQTAEKPQEGDDWRLAVKRGRDGKGAR